MCPVVRIIQNSHFYLILTEYQNISPCVLRKSAGSWALARLGLAGGCVAEPHRFWSALLFAWVHFYESRFPAITTKDEVKRKKLKGCEWNHSRIRRHKPHIGEIKLNLWKGPAEKAGGLQNELQQLCFGWPTTALPLAAAGSAFVSKTDY